jgi:hypothetical protein
MKPPHAHREQSPPLQLQGWKDIADYLGVTVRRAQQWEAELDLPIVRMKLGERFRVLAQRDQLEEWQRTRLLGSQTAVEPAASLPPASRRNTKLTVGLAGGLLLIAIVTLLMAPRPSAVPVSVGVRDGRLEAYDARGHVLWRKVFPEGRARDPVAPPYSTRSLGVWTSNTNIIDDVDGDGVREVVFVLSRTLPMEALQREYVICFDADGRERWRFATGRALAWQGRHFDDGYVVHWVVGPFWYMGHRALAVGAQNVFFPFQVAVLDAANGTMLGEYWHFGSLPAVLVFDQDGDGQREIVAGGVNNPGPGSGLPVLVRLHQPLPEPFAPQVDVFERSAAVRVDYLLLPPVAAFAHEEVPRRVWWMRSDDAKTLQLGVSFGGQLGQKGQIYYVLDSDLDVLDAHPCDLLRDYYERLFREGRVPSRLNDAELAGWRVARRFDHMINANLPEVRGLWAASR